MSIKPILFNTDMVRAILDGRKTVIRRVIKLKYDNTHHEIKTDKYGTRLIEIQDDVEGETFGRNEDGTTWRKIRGYIEPKSPYKKGDILYVRETWCLRYDGEKYFYKADKNTSREEKRLIDYDHVSWKPSIHMPKEAARIFVKVTNVRVERLQEIDDTGVIAEGLQIGDPFDELWNTTIKKSELDRYGWDANPWVWVIEFERCEKPGGDDNEK